MSPAIPSSSSDWSSRHHAAGLVALVLALLFGLHADAGLLAQDKDKVFPLKGSSVVGSITKVTKDAVTIEARNGPQNIPTDQIGMVVYEGEGNAAMRCKELAQRGQILEAMAEFKKLEKGSLEGPGAQSEYAFYQGYLEGRLALMGRGDAEKATKLLLEFVNGNKNSFHFYEAAETLGQLATLLGQYENASKFFKAVTKAPFPLLVARSKYLESNSWLAQTGKLTEARTACTELLAINATEPEVAKIQALGKVNLARCDIAEGKAESALTTLEKLIQDFDSSEAELFARINNAIGECNLALKKPDQAILAFLHTEYFYSSIPDAHAEALYHLTQLWKGRNDQQRAAETQEKLMTLYAGSVWAKKK